MSEFKIDFFELAFLAEACIPPSPIARAMFFNDKYHVSRSRSINEDYIDCVFSLTAP